MGKVLLGATAGILVGLGTGILLSRLGRGVPGSDDANADAIVLEHARMALDLSRRVSRFIDEGDFEAAIVCADRLYALDRTTGWMLLTASLRLARKNEELVELGLDILDVKARNELYVTLLSVFQALEANGTPEQSQDILERRRRSLPPDMYDYFMAGLVAINGEKEAARALLVPLKDDSFWRAHLPAHPFHTGSFLPEKYSGRNEAISGQP